MRIYPKAEANGGGGAPPSWESPGDEEIDKAVAKAFGEEKPAEETPNPDEPAKETPADAPTETPKEEPEKPDEAPPETPAKAAAPKTYTIRGVEYTEEELDDRIRGGMRQDEFTRKTTALAEERRQVAAEREQLLAEKARLSIGDASKAPATASEIEELLNDPEVPEPVAKALRIVHGENRRLTQEIQQRDEQARRDALVDRGLSTFDNTFSELCKKHSVTDTLEMELLHDHIVAQDPNIEDPDALRASVERIFEHSHKGLKQRAEKIRKEAHDDAIAGLKKLPNPPSAKGGSGVLPKSEPKAPATLDDGTATEEFAERLARLQAL